MNSKSSSIGDSDYFRQKMVFYNIDNNNNNDVLNDLDDRRIRAIKPLIPPQILMEDLSLSQQAYVTIKTAREQCEKIISGEDDRLLVIVGPCSIHDPKAAMEYAGRLLEYAQTCSDDLLIVMRVYFEKPRTTVGWKGLINDPLLDGSFKINKGLQVARGLLLALNEMGMPAAVEFLDTISPQYIGDLVSWGAIGARTTESQVHRELASGLSCPVGFKNGTGIPIALPMLILDGNVQIAIDAIKAAREPHHFLSVTKQGLSAIVCTSGNESCHVILRGGATGPNYSPEHVKECAEKLNKSGVNYRLMVDCSHGNSEKNHKNQAKVAKSVVQQLSAGSDALCGVMIESHLVEGKQNISNACGPCGQGLVYGQSITDACIGWEETVQVLEMLRQGVVARREKRMQMNEARSVGDF